MKKDLGSAWVALFVLSLIWGYNWVVMKEALRFAGPFSFVALRTGLGAVALFVIAALWRKPLRPYSLRKLATLGLFQTTGFIILSMLALVSGGAGKVSVLVFTMPFWTLLLAWIFLQERVRGAQWLAIALAGAGLMAILEPWSLHASIVSELLAIAAGLSWAASAVYAKRLQADAGYELLTVTAWQMILGVMPMMVLALTIDHRPVQWTGYFWFALLFAALLGTALGWVLWLFILQRLPAGMASLSVLAIPAVAVISAAIELGERPSATELFGMLCVGVALALISWISAHRAKMPANTGPD